MHQIKREHHFVSQLYLKNWGDNKSRIWSYRLLVPRKDFPKWKRLPIGGVAFQRDLYTVISDNQEDDSFERWIDSEFETPVKDSLLRAINNKKLTSLDWNRLARFLAAQDVRTPLNYFESMERWRKALPEILDKAIKESISALEKHRERTQIPIRANPLEHQFFNQMFDVHISRDVLPETRAREIRAEITTGRKLWLESQRLWLTKTSKVLLKHKWSIVQPASGMSWFTSDNPVLRLHYYKDGSYNLQGGWGRKGGNILMPLSPHHLLFTEIGAEFPDRFEFSIEKTYEIQKFLAERAFRWVFAHKRIPGVERLRPRHVNLEEYKNEEEQWNNWHSEQSAVEK